MRLAMIREVERKELNLFFAAPIGYLFLALFLAVTLFTFFWAEAYFARNVADVRPMFEAMPVLMIFLSAALTMRMWSEERRTGTLEFVATLPASTWEFVIGKFLACWLLLALALLLTLPVPISVSLIANLDWGPVIAGYVAALLLGAAYIAIGLFVSAQSQSQIVALLMTVLVCGLFYLIGSPTLTQLTGGWLTELLYALGSGSRFESITRGMLDVRDLYYYLSIAVAFLTLNVYALEKERWAADAEPTRHNAWRIGTGLLVANVLLANVWLSNVSSVRFDLTEGQQYTLSDATRTYVEQLQEPMLIRGYFSEKTHPLLAPLVPRMKDLLEEYEEIGNGRIRVEIVDPAANPELEDEANTKYGIRSVPFQVTDRYQSTLVNAYFDILITYGDEYEVLDFQDLIEVKARGETDLDVQLRNPEFDVTRSIKTVIYGFQGGGSIFANISEPVAFKGYVSEDGALPEALLEFKPALLNVLEALEAESDGKLTVEMIDPDAAGVAEEIAQQYGFQPMVMSLFDPASFYFYLTLHLGDTVIQLPLPEALSEDATRKGIEEGLKRFATGLTKTLALSAPTPSMGNQFMPHAQQPPRGSQFTQLRDFLSADFNVESSNLQDGSVPAGAEMLLVVDPDTFTKRQLFAVDQFLMRGGTVVVSTGAFDAVFAQQTLTAEPQNSGLEEWLAHHGVTIGKQLVMDPQNSAFPVPVTREVGGFSFQELIMVDYPYFAEVREDGLADLPIFQGLPDITVPWASPINLADDLGERLEVTELLRSSDGAWLTTSTDVIPPVDEFGVSGYLPEGEVGSRLLGVGLQGRFESYFKGQTSPLLESDPRDEEAEEGEEEQDVFTSVVDRSPESARLFVLASNGLFADQTLRMVGAADGLVYGNTVQMMANLAGWVLEDDSLTSIRARGNFNRTLPPMSDGEQTTIEYLNYAFALLGVLGVYLIHRRQRATRRREALAWVEGGAS